jgi:hypothetical protein
MIVISFRDQLLGHMDQLVLVSISLQSMAYSALIHEEAATTDRNRSILNWLGWLQHC